MRVCVWAAIFASFWGSVVFGGEVELKGWDLRSGGFLMDGKALQFRSGELTPYRIPRENWEYALRLVKSAGLDTVTVNIFWNQHEARPGEWDFKTGTLDLAGFLQLAKDEGLAVILRVGPFLGLEADLGGLPAYLLVNEQVNLRHFSDRKFLEAVGNYVEQVGVVVRPFLATKGGPVMMVQVENRYGSYGDDAAYLAFVRDELRLNGVDVPLCTSDDSLEEVLKKGTMPGCAVGLDSGFHAADQVVASRVRSESPSFISGLRPGLRTSWGEQWSVRSDEEFATTLDQVLALKSSFTISPFYGGTQFGLSAGASAQGKGRYQANVTSYDCGAVIDEQGRPTKKFEILRQKMQALDVKSPLPGVPEARRLMEIGAFELKPVASIWEALEKQPEVGDVPKSFEVLGLYRQGLVIYSAELPNGLGGALDFGDMGVRDFALVYLDGKLIGKLDRAQGDTKIELPKTTLVNPRLDVVVEAMGHLSEGTEISLDWKGLGEQISLAGRPLRNWAMYPISLEGKPRVREKAGDLPVERSGYWFRGVCELYNVDDTFLDLSNFQKGYVWVNGYLLGRYWNIGPQQRLFCPRSFLKKGGNEVLVLDLLQKTGTSVRGVTTLKP